MALPASQRNIAIALVVVLIVVIAIGYYLMTKSTTCTDSTGCTKAPNTACVGGKCAAPCTAASCTGSTPQCNLTAGATAFGTCVASTLTACPPASTCTSPTQYCVGGTCSGTACTATSQCASPQTCDTSTGQTTSGSCIAPASSVSMRRKSERR